MLSKLLSALQPSRKMESVETEGIWTRLSTYLVGTYSSVTRLDMEAQWGTLGVLSAWKVDGKDIIAKTHLPEERFRQNIDKEYLILRALYGKELFIDKAVVENGNNTFSILLVEKLAPLERKVHPKDVLALLDSVQQMPQLWEECGYCVKDLSIYRERALTELADAGVLDSHMAEYLQDMGTELKEILSGPHTLAHGDLSNPNILCKGEKLYLLDWEDAFLCTPDYDFLYWMTFLSQQEFCNKKDFERLGIRNRRSEVLLMTIILLKSYISFLTGAYKQYRVSINARLQAMQQIFA